MKFYNKKSAGILDRRFSGYFQYNRPVSCKDSRMQLSLIAYYVTAGCWGYSLKCITANGKTTISGL